MKVKPIADVAKKWADVTPGRSSYYEAGAVGAGADWEKNTAGAKGTFKAAISAAGIEDRFAGGVKKAGAAKFDRKVKDVGVSRFGPGVSAAQPDFTNGITPYLDTLASMTLPARAPRGSEANMARVSAIATTLHKKRLAQMAAG
jgi:hypothetical protein